MNCGLTTFEMATFGLEREMEQLAFIEEVLAKAADVLEFEQSRELRVEVKKDSSIVTQADLASEKVILDAIRAEFPDDIVYSEESGLSSQLRRPGSHIWIVDPLDGTTNYANAYPFYCVSIARGVFLETGRIEVLAGGVRDVPRARTYLAEKGQGAEVDGRPLKVAGAKEFSQNFLCTGFYYSQGESLSSDVSAFERVAQKCQAIRRDGAAALDLALVAEGVFDAFWERGLQPWDVAAGALLVEEAGGRVGNYQTSSITPYDIEGVGVVAGNAQAVAEIKKLIDLES